MNISIQKCACLRTMLSVFILTMGLGFITPVKANNVELYATSFEPPIFANGVQLLGLDGWSTAIPPFLNPAAVKITNLAASHRRQSVEVRGADLIGSEGITAPYDAVGSYRRPIGQEISAARPRVRISVDMLLETNQPTTLGEFFSLTFAARSGDGETLGEVGLSSQGIAEAFGFDVAPGDPPAFTKPILFNQWYRISMLLDYQNRTTSYYLNNRLLGTVNAPSASDVLLRVALVVYARPNFDPNTGPSSERSNYTARFDKLRVSADKAQD